MAEEANLWEAGRQPLEDIVRAIGGAVVDDDQFPLHVFGQGSGENQRNAPFDDRALVVDRHYDRQLHVAKIV